MKLNLTPFQHPSPYPALQNVAEDPALAEVLLSGYCGERSELTTILQYAYHSLECTEVASEYSNILRGIFYVETIHMELLGNCIRKLGGNIEYLLPLQEKKISWQASVVNYLKTPLEMITDDIEGEKLAAKFYSDMAMKTNQQDIAHLLRRLSEDEKLHVRMLEQLKIRLY